MINMGSQMRQVVEVMQNLARGQEETYQVNLRAATSNLIITLLVSLVGVIVLQLWLNHHLSVALSIRMLLILSTSLSMGDLRIIWMIIKMPFSCRKLTQFMMLVDPHLMKGIRSFVFSKRNWKVLKILVPSDWMLHICVWYPVWRYLPNSRSDILRNTKGWAAEEPTSGLSAEK